MDQYEKITLKCFNLKEEELEIVIEALSKYKYFYHATPPQNVPSILVSGIDPSCEDERSSYPRGLEPPAMRFATIKAAADVARAVASRCEIGQLIKPVLLRVRSSVLLRLPFGLDHSFSCVMNEFEALEKAGKVPLSAEDFLALIDRWGFLSCHGAISPSDVERSDELDMTTSLELENLAFTALRPPDGN